MGTRYTRRCSASPICGGNHTYYLKPSYDLLTYYLTIIRNLPTTYSLTILLGDQALWVRVDGQTPVQGLDVDCNAAERTHTRQVVDGRATFTFESWGR